MNQILNIKYADTEHFIENRFTVFRIVAELHHVRNGPAFGPTRW